MKEPNRETIDRLIREYKIVTDSTASVELKARVDKKTRIFRIDREGPLTFIIDTPMAREIACYPHIVGEPLEEAARQAAAEALPAILELSDMPRGKGSPEIIFEQILRAAPGYKLQEVAPGVLGKSYRTIYLRPRYTHRSYRDHDGAIQREIEVVHQNFSEFPRGKKLVLVMQDTVASGRSGEVSIEAALKQCEQSQCKIEKWILYGFMSEYGLDILYRIAKQNDISMVAFAMGNLTALSTNNYDMPLYGVDEAHWQKTHTIRKLGSIIDRTSLEEYVPCFVPGADQPGDWSARQLSLFNGVTYEPGDILGHLNNSIRLIKSLLEIGSLEPWQQRIAQNELDLLSKALQSETRNENR